MCILIFDFQVAYCQVMLVVKMKSFEKNVKKDKIALKHVPLLKKLLTGNLLSFSL